MDVSEYFGQIDGYPIHYLEQFMGSRNGGYDRSGACEVGTTCCPRVESISRGALMLMENGRCRRRSDQGCIVHRARSVYSTSLFSLMIFPLAHNNNRRKLSQKSKQHLSFGHVTMKASGTEYLGLCRFHNNAPTTGAPY